MRDTIGRMIATSPQIHDELSTSRIMWTVSVCLIPAAGWGVFVFGLRSLVILAAAVVASVLTEAVCAAIFGRHTILDGSAFLTGLLVGMNMPPSIPVYIPVVASVFAVAVVKWTFGGLGANWMNPALAGRVFVFFSWTGPMTQWTTPRTYPSADALSSATPLGFLKTGLLEGAGGAAGPADFLSRSGYPVTVFARNVSDWFASKTGVDLPHVYIDGFFGNIPGCIGEVSAFLLLLGTVYLFVKKIITWHIPVSYLGSFGLFILLFGGGSYGGGIMSGDVLFHLFTGGLVLGAFYMATDMVTSPISGKGMIVYGIGAGFLTFLIRSYGSFPEGVSLAIILMNIFVPLIDRFTRTVPFGSIGKGREA